MTRRSKSSVGAALYPVQDPRRYAKRHPVWMDRGAIPTHRMFATPEPGCVPLSGVQGVSVWVASIGIAWRLSLGVTRRLS